MKKIIALLVLLSSSYSFANEALIENAKNMIKSQLKDPYSAQFENIYIGKTENNLPVVCGEVNAKNSYGAYVGRKKFYYFETSDKPMLGMESELAFNVLHEVFCLNN